MLVFGGKNGGDALTKLIQETMGGLAEADDEVQCPQCLVDQRANRVRICPLCGDDEWDGAVRRWQAEAWNLDRRAENAGVII